jgi:hypothetical protein
VKKLQEPLDFSKEAFVCEYIIRQFAECCTTSQVLDLLEKVQEHVTDKKYHLRRDRIREQIRTMNPNNKKIQPCQVG